MIYYAISNKANTVYNVGDCGDEIAAMESAQDLLKTMGDDKERILTILDENSYKKFYEDMQQ